LLSLFPDLPTPKIERSTNYRNHVITDYYQQTAIGCVVGTSLAMADTSEDDQSCGVRQRGRHPLHRQTRPVGHSPQLPADGIPARACEQVGEHLAGWRVPVYAAG